MAYQPQYPMMTADEIIREGHQRLYDARMKGIAMVVPKSFFWQLVIEADLFRQLELNADGDVVGTQYKGVPVVIGEDPVIVEPVKVEQPIASSAGSSAGAGSASAPDVVVSDFTMAARYVDEQEAKRKQEEMAKGVATADQPAPVPAEPVNVVTGEPVIEKVVVVNPFTGKPVE
jgi:hypothetical protein